MPSVIYMHLANAHMAHLQVIEYVLHIYVPEILDGVVASRQRTMALTESPAIVRWTRTCARVTQLASGRTSDDRSSR